MDGQTPIGHILRTYRQQRGWSLRDLEARSGVNWSNIGKLERGEVMDPSILTVARLCQALGVSVDRLLGEAGLVPHPDDPSRPATRADIDELRAYVVAAMRQRTRRRR